MVRSKSQGAVFFLWKAQRLVAHHIDQLIPILITSRSLFSVAIFTIFFSFAPPPPSLPSSLPPLLPPSPPPSLPPTSLPSLLPPSPPSYLPPSPPSYLPPSPPSYLPPTSLLPPSLLPPSLLPPSPPSFQCVAAFSSIMQECWRANPQARLSAFRIKKTSAEIRNGFKIYN